jgi:hypothetical protein
MNDVVWAEPKIVTDIEDCYFYHTMDIPSHGTVQGEWDLRGKEAEYLGNINLKGKRVLELGTASGHLCFSMEKMGAEVVAYDLDENQEWDIVPFAGFDYKEHIALFKQHIRKLNNGYWLAHKANNSAAKMVYGTVYQIPDSIGQFDVCTLGSILLHLRDPFLALQRVADHVDKTIIVADILPRLRSRAVEFLTRGRLIHFFPDARTCAPYDTWWKISPKTLEEFLRILGFEDIEIHYHEQLFKGVNAKLYTMVGHRR